MLLVTSNIRHLPQAAFEGTRVRPARPGAVLKDMLAVQPAVADVLDAMLRRFKNPPVAKDDLLDILDATNCRTFATALGNAWGFSSEGAGSFELFAAPVRASRYQNPALEPESRNSFGGPNDDAFQLRRRGPRHPEHPLGEVDGARPFSVGGQAHDRALLRHQRRPYSATRLAASSSATSALSSR